MHNLDAFFSPKSVALIGATNRNGSVGLGIAKNLLAGKKQRKIFFVNPNKKIILGKRAYQSIRDIPQKLDLAIIAVPAPVVLSVAEDCRQKKVRGVIIISSGFAESGHEGAKRERKVAELFQESGIIFLGPNCLGVISPENNFNSSFAPALPKKGGVAFISQSGALIDVLIDYCLTETYGFSGLVSYGNEAGLSLSDFLDYFAQDKSTKTIALYLEAVRHGRQFLRAAQRAARKKPVVVLKGGKTKLGSRAVLSHTAALSGDEQIYSAAFRQAGLFEVRNLRGLIDVSLAFSQQPRFKGKVGVITNAGALGVLAADECDNLGIILPNLSIETKNKIKQSGIFGLATNFKNPLDILGDALSNRYEVATNAMLNQKNINALIALVSYQIMTDVEDIARVIVKAAKRFPTKPIVVCMVNGGFTTKAAQILKKSAILVYPTPEAAALAIKALSI